MKLKFLPFALSALCGVAAAQGMDKIQAAVQARSTAGLTPAEINHVYWITPEQLSPAQVAANKETALEWWRLFWDHGDMDDWAKWLSPSIGNHDPQEPPRGAQALVDQLKHVLPKGKAGFGPADGSFAPHSFAIADGDLVFVGQGGAGWNKPDASVDPLLGLVGDVVRINGGKIQEWWFVAKGAMMGPPRPGAVAPKPQAAPAGFDFSKGSTRPVDHQGSMVVFDSGTSSATTQAANKKLVQAWLDDFGTRQNYASWPKYMTADFRDHDRSHPAQGAQALVDYLESRPDLAARKDQASAHMFMLAEGDLVFLCNLDTQASSFDPEEHAGLASGNVFQIKNGKIAASWPIGQDLDAPAGQ
jgi:predicted SnoaL-like aldol condensation-catalyzing enzyme